ncbi:MAG: hypothetical protein H6510_15695 [Acidobacteria bacterium]|nr:hypothetical protein [Acidobacteriota bacterium]MCB9399255.1 hypothetical protein [Acidobacteriota bacterium]
MKRIISAMLAMVASVALFATNDITLTTAASTASVTAQGTTVNAVDLNTVGAGNTFCVSVNIANTDFTLAGFEFQVFYPPFLTLLSTNNGEWASDTGAVFSIGSGLSGSIQKLPADAAGVPNASQVNNGLGSARLGVLFTDAMDRLAPTTGPVEIAQLCFQVNANFADDTTCTSTLEAIRVLLVPSPTATSADIFANDSAARVAVVGTTPQDAFGRGGLPLYIGDPSAPLRGDWNGNGSRTSGDALGALRCCALTTASPLCTNSPAAPLAYLNTALDYNCSNTVTAADTLGNLRLTAGVSNRPSKKTEYYEGLGKKGTLVVNSENTKGSMASNAFWFDGVKAIDADIDEAAKKEGWIIVTEQVGQNYTYVLVNAAVEMHSIPKVYIGYEQVSENGRVALLSSEHQKTDYSMFTYSPLIEDHSGPQGDKTEKLEK